VAGFRGGPPEAEREAAQARRPRRRAPRGPRDDAVRVHAERAGGRGSRHLGLGRASRRRSHGALTYVRHRLALQGGELTLLQPSDAAELPDDRDVEWAPLVPYWSVLWRSGIALAHDVSEADVAGRRVLELGCGLGVPSLAAARGGADVLATDGDEEALELLERNARENGVAVATACV